MHESTTTSEPQLTDAEVDAAYRRTVERGEGLLRRRRARSAAVGGLVVVVLLAGGFGILKSLSEDRTVAVTPAGEGRDAGDERPAGDGSTASTTATAAAAETQPGYDLRAEGPVYVLTRTTPDGVTTSQGDGVAIGGGLATERNVAVVGSRVVDTFRVEVTFACSGPVGNMVDEARYRLDGSTVVVAATVTSGGVGADCTDGRGASAVLTFPEGGVPSGATVVAGEV